MITWVGTVSYGRGLTLSVPFSQVRAEDEKTDDCCSHLFTELVKVDQRTGSPTWRAFRTTVSRLLKDAIRLSQRTEVNPATRDRLLSTLKARLEQLIDEPADDPDVKRLIKRLKRHRHELFTLLEHDR